MWRSSLRAKPNPIGLTNSSCSCIRKSIASDGVATAKEHAVAIVYKERKPEAVLGPGGSSSLTT